MVERAIGEMVGSDRVRPKDYMRTFAIDDEFFNQSAIETTPRSSCRPALEKLLDTADIVRDGRIVRMSYKWLSGVNGSSLRLATVGHIGVPSFV
jgi:hypothetical protein